MSLSLKFSIHGGEGFSSEDRLQLPEGDGAVFFSSSSSECLRNYLESPNCAVVFSKLYFFIACTSPVKLIFCSSLCAKQGNSFACLTLE